MATSATKTAAKSAKNTDEAEAPPEKSKKLIFLLVAVIVLAIASALGTWFYLSGDRESKKEEHKPPVFLILDTVTVNLQPTEDELQQYLQVGMTLQVEDQDQAELIKLYMPQVRSRLLTLLSNKKAAELLTPNGKEKLAAEIIAQLKLPFAAKGPQAKLSNVFFTSFVVQ
ncbi:MAG TPA: flagellar basal body-associated protein FliL [Noviherbaspirillum sp.]|jgi:flagellar FliL protein|nr:flagellar basal body-associated protein FliL [Noviherbaspirillum sp.]